MSHVTPVMAIATMILSLLLDPWSEFQKNSYFDNPWHVMRSCLLMLIGGSLAFFMVTSLTWSGACTFSNYRIFHALLILTAGVNRVYTYFSNKCHNRDDSWGSKRSCNHFGNIWNWSFLKLCFYLFSFFVVESGFFELLVNQPWTALHLKQTSVWYRWLTIEWLMVEKIKSLGTLKTGSSSLFVHTNQSKKERKEKTQEIPSIFGRQC